MNFRIINNDVGERVRESRRARERKRERETEREQATRVRWLMMVHSDMFHFPFIPLSLQASLKSKE